MGRRPARRAGAHRRARRNARRAAILDRAVESYSGGQRRRLEIARALVSGPRVLFLDEPTVGLDPRIRFELLDAIAGLRRREEMAIALTTHYLDEAERLCDRVAIIHAGELVALDTPAALLAGLGLVDPHDSGLHDIWGMSNTTTEAWLSLAVVILFAAAFSAIAVRAFTRSAVR